MSVSVVDASYFPDIIEHKHTLAMENECFGGGCFISR